VRRIQQSLGITTIYVTHDQGEALSISDKVAVMRAGRVMSVGAPKEIYLRPSNDFVASFVGKANLFAGTLMKLQGGIAVVSTEIGNVSCGLDGVAYKEGDKVVVSIKPENVILSASGEGGQNIFQGKVEFTSYLGAFSEILVSVGRGSEHRVKVVKTSEGLAFADGQVISVKFPPQNCSVLPPGTALEFRKKLQLE